jgi:hypothetical protein
MVGSRIKPTTYESRITPSGNQPNANRFNLSQIRPQDLGDKQAFAGVNVISFDATMAIVSPLLGLRPCRSGLLWTLNFPNPGMEISSPLATASTKIANTPATNCFAAALEMPWA